MRPDFKTGRVSKLSFWTGWVFSAIPIMLMFVGGFYTIGHTDMVQQQLNHFGYPDNFARKLIVIEMACGLIYAIPQTAVLGAILLTGYLGGTVATHLRVGEAPVPPIVLGVLVWLGLLLRDSRLRGLIPLRRLR